jgi:hypothetical protein
MYASFLRLSRALHPGVFEQPAENYFFNNLPDYFAAGGRSYQSSFTEG